MTKVMIGIKGEIIKFKENKLKIGFNIFIELKRRNK